MESSSKSIDSWIKGIPADVKSSARVIEAEQSRSILASYLSCKKARKRAWALRRGELSVSVADRDFVPMAYTF